MSLKGVSDVRVLCVCVCLYGVCLYLCVCVCVAYNDLESVEEGWGVCQASKLRLGGVVLGHVPVGSSAQKHFLNAAVERVAQVLHRVDHDPPIDRFT